MNPRGGAPKRRLKRRQQCAVSMKPLQEGGAVTVPGAPGVSPSMRRAAPRPVYTIVSRTLYPAP